MKKLFASSFAVVIVSLLMIKFILSPVMNKIVLTSMAPAIEQHNQDLARGVYYLVRQELAKSPPREWQDRIRQLQPRFGYPLVLRDYRQVGFTPQQTAKLMQGQIVVIKDGKQFWQLADNSTYAIGMGPLPEVKTSASVEVLVWIAIASLIGSVLLIWVLLFWRKLLKVIATTTEFGNGNLDTRLAISRRSSLAPLANAFNGMADRIQNLIKSHKELTNAVSHELRTPISRIRFGLEMMKSAKARQARDAYAEGIQRDVDELDELVNELLGYARFDRESARPDRRACAVDPWCRQVIAPHNMLYDNIRFTSTLDEGATAQFDPRQMARAVGNLLQNAERYGNGQVELSVEQRDGALLIHVDDNGPGIPAPDRERIFHPFTRLEASRSKETGGYGLGLAIAKRIVESHGATLHVADSPLGGSRFTIRL
jgi:signal transduction histidine kinase